jgi:hypothetical protein
MFVTRKLFKPATERKVNIPLLLKERECFIELDIMADLLGDLTSSIEKIKSYPSCEQRFPNVMKYIQSLNESEYITLNYFQLFKFKFMNICSQMLLTITTGKLIEDIFYEFTWIIDDKSFGNEEVKDLEALRVKIQFYEGKYECSISDIATKGYIIPPLIMNDIQYTQSSVPIILALNLLFRLGFNTCIIGDESHIAVNCGTELKRISLLSERLLVCRKSIYYKYGFTLISSGQELKDDDSLCKIKISELINDFKARTDNWEEYQAQIMKINRQYRENKSIEISFKRAFADASALMDEFSLLHNKNITIRDYLLGFPQKERNCKVALLLGLTNKYLNIPFEHQDVIYGMSKFYTLYNITIRDSVFRNSDIKQTIQTIYEYGLVN